MKVSEGECVKVECEGREIGIMWTRWGWCLVEPTDERDRNVVVRVVYEPSDGPTEFVRAPVSEANMVRYQGQAFIRTKQRWDNLPEREEVTDDRSRVEQ